MEYVKVDEFESYGDNPDLLLNRTCVDSAALKSDRGSQFYAALSAMCGMPYLAPVLIGR